MISSRAKPHELSAANERYEGEQEATGCGQSGALTRFERAAVVEPPLSTGKQMSVNDPNRPVDLLHSNGMDPTSPKRHLGAKLEVRATS
jgi:hypothetical protein